MSQQLIKGGKVELLYQTAKHDATIFSADHELWVYLFSSLKKYNQWRTKFSDHKKDVMLMKLILLQITQMISSVNHLIPLAANSSLTLRR